MGIGRGQLAEEITQLKREDPQRFGYLSRYWEDAERGLNNTSRNYACVSQIYENIPEPHTDTRGLGQTLVLLTDLDVLDVQTRRNNATIYDLTAYDSERLAVVGHLLDRSS